MHKFTDSLVDTNATNKILETEKNELDNKLKEYIKKIDRLEKEILDTTKKTRGHFINISSYFLTIQL